ncbi:sensor histidine kinase [Bosea sp. R86505]|uniref:sensor histidine kinase n=1 Tax=Bosea sp. R86505 TaxID=3101710 RepID=UPI00366D8AC1
MSEAPAGREALAAPASAPRTALWLGAYLALQSVVVGLCLLLAALPAPEPPARYALTQARLEPAGRTVQLPHHLDVRFTMDDPPLFRLSFEGPALEGDAWAVMLPRFTNGVVVAVNGVAMIDSRRTPSANRPDRSTPEIAVVPSVLLRPGVNEITVRLLVWGPLTGFLDRVYVGPDAALRPAYERRVLLFETLPVVLAAWQSILAVILGMMWLMRRHEPEYGALAASMALGVTQTFISAPSGQSLYGGLNAVLIASAPLESAFAVVFFVLFLGLRLPRAAALLFLPGLIITVVGLLAGPVPVRRLYLLLGPFTVMFCLVLTAVIIALVFLRRRDMITLVLGSAVTVVLFFWAFDIFSILDVASDRRIFFSRISYSAMVIAIGIGLTWRFARALNQVDGFASRMVTLVREAEDKLRATLARDEERARAVALADERTRLMRDLHDGLGGQLVSIVALSERQRAEPIGEAARAALKDLRLVIDAMDDIGGDLMLALGAWRERIAAQLRAHSIALAWRVLTPQGLPLHPELRPGHVIQILRLLDEAVTNAVKHAGAGTITVAIETVATADGHRGRISVRDDGRGFEAPAGSQTPPLAGRGLANMRRRAERCGAQLAIVSGPEGTCVTLDLPGRFADLDAPRD